MQAGIETIAEKRMCRSIARGLFDRGVQSLLNIIGGGSNLKHRQIEKTYYAESFHDHETIGRGIGKKNEKIANGERYFPRVKETRKNLLLRSEI